MISSKPAPWKSLIKHIAAGGQHAVGKIQRELRQIHRPGLIHGIDTRQVWGHIGQYKVDFRAAEARLDLFEDAFLAKIALHEVHARNRVHRQNVGRDDPARAADDARRVLAPPARRGPEIDAANPGPQQPLGRLNLGELEDRARAPAFRAARA